MGKYFLKRLVWMIPIVLGVAILAHRGLERGARA